MSSHTTLACIAGLMLLSSCYGESTAAADALSSAGVAGSPLPYTSTKYMTPCQTGCEEKVYVPEISTSRCTATAVSFGESSSSDAVIELVAEAGAMSCGGGSVEAIVETTASGIAHACAIAIAETSATCETTGNATGCAVSSAEVTQVADAIGAASATAFAEAAMACGCTVDAAVMTSAIKNAVAVAHATSASDVCVSGNASASAENYSEAFSATFIEFYASAVAGARTGAECSAFADAEANFKVWSDSGAINNSKIQAEAMNGSAKADAVGNALINETDAAKLFKPEGKELDLTMDMCSNQSGCCKHAFKNYIFGDWFKNNCEGCNFEALESIEECEAL